MVEEEDQLLYNNENIVQFQTILPQWLVPIADEQLGNEWHLVNTYKSWDGILILNN